ncbi:MAG: LacI family DNA-binding transcriptional regulator [Chloroflexota bacterium]|nr:MAG: LacI family transcriptional regulator [Chloroflexota bacterium]
MPTIREVADQARVSVATVSRVINKSGYVSIDLQERVENAMRSLNYHPSALARSLRRQETQTIGVLVPQLNHPFFSTLAYAIEKTLFDAEYRAFMCSAEEDPLRECAYIDMLLRQRVDGVILVPTGQSASNLGRLIEQGVPVVLVDRDVPGFNVSRVLCNNERGAYEATRHLLALGHRHIGMIGGPEYSPPMRARVNGVRAALAEAGIHDTPQVLVPHTLYHVETGYNAAMQLLKAEPLPTAIFALTDVMAMGVLRAANELGLRVPEQLSVMGFDDTPMAAYSIPELTTVRQPIFEMGQLATRVLLERIGHAELPVAQYMLDTCLIERASTAPPA